MGNALLLGTVEPREASFGAPLSTTLPHALHSPHRPTQRLVVQLHSVHLRERRVAVEAMPRTPNRPADSRLRSARQRVGDRQDPVVGFRFANGDADPVGTITGHERPDSQPTCRECFGVGGGPRTGRQPDGSLGRRARRSRDRSGLGPGPARLHQLSHPHHQLFLGGQCQTAAA